MRKPAFCICENKGADSYIDSTIPLLPKSEMSSHLLWLYSPVYVGNLKQVFSQSNSFISALPFTVIRHRRKHGNCTEVNMKIFSDVQMENFRMNGLTVYESVINNHVHV